MSYAPAPDFARSPAAPMAQADQCRSCGAPEPRPFYASSGLPVQSCVLLPTREEALSYPVGDLELVFCASCGFISNRLFDPLRQGTLDAYESSQAFSPRFNTYMDELCRGLVERHAVRRKDVVEIGCGHGDFVRRLCELGENRGVGFDPAGPETGETGDLEAGTLRFVRENYGERHFAQPADLIACRHTLEHVPNVGDFLRMVAAAARRQPRAQIFFEVPDMERILREHAFWDIYYEHCSDFTLDSLAALFRFAGLQILELGRVYGDQYLVIVARPGSANADEASLPREDAVGDLLSSIDAFDTTVARELRAWRSRLEAYARQSRRIALWGSGSKAAGFLATLGIRDEIPYVVDINLRRQGRFQATTGQEIVAPDRLREYRPDVVIIMNAISTDEIRNDLRAMHLEP